MWKALRRLFWLALIGGAGYGAYATWQRKQEPRPDGPAEWPPLDDAATPAPPVTIATARPADDASGRTAPVAGFARVETNGDDGDDGGDAGMSGRWVAPVDGRCPPDYPIKANDNSGIYHVPGGRFYDRTIPERCYADENDAVADGYRRAKA